MSYLVLARKWRPRRFAELVGQEHVVRALSNALDSGRVHHAFLFTGTRGVGKTTIARIFAKSLNCERGVGAEPCGVCAVCEAVDAGRFVDLLEIDAASNTGVDDVREVIENAQYMPTRGRYKVYLIDEVHMLSKNAFNALLKTLEEPPEHVKFLLATTDPQKLPVTVLSRCLQFNLKRLTEEQIGGQMTHILAQEGIEADSGSIALLARGADGSLRDGLSLLDQALAFCGGALREPDVRTMLGTVDRAHVGEVLKALAGSDGKALLDAMGVIATFAPDYGAALDEVAEALHRVQLLQLVPGAEVSDERIDLPALARAVPAELVQVWYQMAVNGRRDLYIAPSERVGFEMTLLRMLAFRPAEMTGKAPSVTSQTKTAPSAPSAPTDRSLPATGSPTGSTPATSASRAHAAPPASAAANRSVPQTGDTVRAEALDPVPLVPRAHSASRESAPRESAPREFTSRESSLHESALRESTSRESAPRESASRESAPRESAPRESNAHESARLLDSNDWLDLLEAARLSGPARELAACSAFVSYTGVVLKLALPEAKDVLRADNIVRQLAITLGDHLGAVPRIEFVAPRADGAAETLHDRKSRERSQKQADAEAGFANDATVQRLVSQFGARVQTDAIRPLDDH